MKEVDIFAEGQSMDMQWWVYPNVGDKIQGTYVDHFMAEDQFKNNQHVYVLKKSDGSLWKVGIKEYKIKFIEQMNSIRFGQIVGIQFTGTMKPKTGTNLVKLLSITAKSSIVDQEWLDGQKGQPAVTPQVYKVNSVDVPEHDEDAADINIPSDPFKEAVAEEANPFANVVMEPEKKETDAEKIQRIAELSKTKLNVTDVAGIKTAVTEATSLTLVPSNLDAIISKLESLSEAV